jgi:protein-disulfide isomerase
MTQARRQRLWQLGALIVAGALVVAIAVAVVGGGSTPPLRPGRPVPHAAADQAPFAGIPEQGTALGSPTAPVTLVELADLQCPVCAAFARDALPGLVRDEVRPGRLRIVFAPLTFIGPDSARGARMALAAGAQNRLWPFTALVYANQRDENSGYVTDGFLTALAQSTAGLDGRAALAARAAPALSAALASAAAEAKRLRVTSTPSFALSRTGATPLSFSPAGLQAGAFEARIEQLAAGRAH